MAILHTVSAVHGGRIQRFHVARDVEEVLSLLSAYAGAGALLAGGVDLLRGPLVRVTGLIDITRIGLSTVAETRGGLTVGATATLTQLLESPVAARYAGGILAEVLGDVAVPPLRNMATIGGALVSAHPWGDIPTALVALGAAAHLQGDKEAKSLVEDLYRGEFRKVFRSSVVTEIVFPPWEGAFAHEKVGRTRSDIALLNACCGVGLRDGSIVWARVAVGARPDRGERLPEVEQALQGRAPSDALWKEIGELVEARVEVGDDRRAGGAWRRRAAGVLVCRALKRAAQRAAT